MRFETTYGISAPRRGLIGPEIKVFHGKEPLCRPRIDFKLMMHIYIYNTNFILIFRTEMLPRGEAYS